MNRSILFQVINGYLSTLALCAGVIFIRYLKKNYKLGYEELRPAIALLFFWAFEVILRGPVFYSRTLTNAGIPMEEPDFSIIVGGSGVALCFLCMIRVFSPNAWGIWSWLGSLIFSTIIVGLSLLYAYGVI